MVSLVIQVIAGWIDSARMQELWSSVDMRGFCIGAAYRPLLLIYSVVGSVPTEAWADPQRDGKCGSPLRGGADCEREGITYNVPSIVVRCGLNSTNF